MTPVVDALGAACLIVAGACILGVLFHIVERVVSAVVGGRGIFDRSKRRHG